jgi:hypothetical protein
VVKLGKTIMKFAKNPLEGLKQLAENPLFADLPGVQFALKLYETLKNDGVGAMAGQAVKGVGQAIIQNNPITKAIQAGKQVASGDYAGAGATVASSVIPGFGLLRGAVRGVRNRRRGSGRPPTDEAPTTTTLSKGAINVPNFVESAVGVGTQGKGLDAFGVRLFNNGVDVSGVNPTLWNNFLGMTQEYNSLTGNTVQLNSAYRDINKQRELYESLPDGQAAPPGRSLHNFGYALDINSKEANEMNRMGLFDRWGFTRPFNSEPWHLEPKGIDRQRIKSTGTGVVSNIGDPAMVPMEPDMGIINQNLANASNRSRVDIPKQAFNYGNREISLNEDSINKLANRFGEMIRVNTPQTNIKHAINADARA